MARQMTDREIHIQNAIDFVRAGGKIRHGAREFRVPESTLRDRLRGRVSLNWILAEERAGRAPMKAQVLAFAESIAAINGKAGPFGNNWVDRFLQRNEEVQTKVSQALEALRALSTTEDHVRAHIRRLTQLQLERNFTPSNTYNADETGVTEGESAAGRPHSSTLWNTPSNSQDLQAQLTALEDGVDDIKRTVRRIATKAGKQLDKKNAEIAGLKHQNASLASQLASSARSGRKKVQYNPNGHFAAI
ncbi:hypothetical protein S40293_10028 [Stachybotrys chartarum IBT 40293]|nr:hypothetical protein S40293_10028 [Stachybotrys chartarum IBT 40293]